MRAFPENFEWLHFTEAHFGAPQVMGQDIVLPVINLPVQGDHPLRIAKDKIIRQHPALGGVVNGLLVFRDVSLSKRRMSDYIGDPMSPECRFSEDYEVVDIDTNENDENLKLYSFEGRLDEPPAVIAYWDILARSFELQVD
jgi:hypothetical protein